MYTQSRNFWRTLGSLLIANTLGAGVVSAQTAPPPAGQARKADPRFTVKTETTEKKGIFDLDPAVVVGADKGCPVLLVMGCSSSPLGVFRPQLGVFGGKVTLPPGTVLLDGSTRYDR